MNNIYDEQIINDFLDFKYIENGEVIIYYLPNIFTFEISGLAFVLFYDKLLLIPGYMIKIYIDKKPIFNLYLNQINEIKHTYDLSKIKEKNLFKIINQNIELKNDNPLFKNQIFCEIIVIIIINLYSKLENNKYFNDILKIIIQLIETNIIKIEIV